MRNLDKELAVLNPEHILIPYQVSPLPEGPWLVFAPHADDETFGMGGALLKARGEGIETHVVVLTDGALGGAQDNLVAVRNREVEKACAQLGVESLQCWQEPDRGLKIEQRLVERIDSAIELIKPASVFFPGPLEIHPDHRATAHLVWAALQHRNRANQCPEAYSYEISVQSPANVLLDITAQQAEKLSVINIYLSQNSENNYPEMVMAGNVSRTFSLPEEVKYAEAYYRYSKQELGNSLKQVTHGFIDLYF